MVAELSDIEAKLKAAREEGLRDGEVNTKLNIVISQNEKLNEQLTQIREAIAPVQVIANRALDAANANIAAHQQIAGRVTELEKNSAKASDVKELDKRVDAISERIAYAAGIAAIAGAVLAYAVPQIVALVIR